MGLNLCYHILKRMGGSLQLIPSNYKGTSFEMKIPLHRAKIKENRPLLDSSIPRNFKKVTKIARKTNTPKAVLRQKLMECEFSPKDDDKNKQEPLKVEEIACDDFVEWAKAIFEKAKKESDQQQNSQLML
jgi:hypothetical protein